MTQVRYSFSRKHLRYFIITFLFLLSSCYRAPGEEDYSMIPTTNNPGLIRDSGSFAPGITY